METARVLKKEHHVQGKEPKGGTKEKLPLKEEGMHAPVEPTMAKRNHSTPTQSEPA